MLNIVFHYLHDTLRGTQPFLLLIYKILKATSAKCKKTKQTNPSPSNSTISCLQQEM